MRNLRAGSSGFEALEDRILLAGDVSAVLQGSTLYIVGDSAGNDVNIGQDDLGNITVQGADGTSINHDSSGNPLAFSGVKNISVFLDGGDDRLIIGGEDEAAETDVTSAEEEGDEEGPKLSLAGSLTVLTGSGDDVVRMSFTQVQGNVTILTDGGNDAVDLGRGPGFGGEDHVEPAVATTLSPSLAPSVPDEGGGPPSDVRIGGSLTIVTGCGDDGVKVGFTDVQNNVTINTGDGNDNIVTGRGPINNVHGPGEGGGEPLVAAASGIHGNERPADSHFGGSFTVLSGGGDDMVVVRNTDIARSAFVSTDGGNDAVALDNVGVGGCTTILEGWGDDILLVRGSDFGGGVTALTGLGNDAVYIQNNTFSSYAILNTEFGNDAVTVKGNDFQGVAWLDGGLGTDALTQSDNTFASKPFVFGFERNESNFDFGPVNQKINNAFAGFMMGGPVG
ncbi:MAG: LEPR-XLL domain-containing protein [Planctomycetes bacterium]|nr:LEPR-XLL domain-containing protein [Planctomycetota bacterium]